jgi:hypothetical protein
MLFDLMYRDIAMHVHSVVIKMSGCMVLKIVYYKNDLQAPARLRIALKKFRLRL